MTTDYIEAPQPLEQNSKGDNASQNLLKDCDMKAYVSLNDADFNARNTAGKHLPDVSINLSDAQVGNSKFSASDFANIFTPSSPRAPEHLDQIRNAEKHLPGLIAKSGALADGRTGLNEQDIQKLKQNPNLTRDEKNALEFLEKNFAKLRDRDWSGLNVLTEKEINVNSFKDRWKDTDPVDRQHPRDQQQPRDRQQQPRDRQAQPGQREQREPEAARNFDDTKVLRGKGTAAVAQKMLEGQGLGQREQKDLTDALQRVTGGRVLREGEPLVNENNLESVRRSVQQSRNPQLIAWFNNRYPSR